MQIPKVQHLFIQNEQDFYQVNKRESQPDEESNQADLEARVGF